MNRREFIAGLGAAACASLPALAQAPRRPVVALVLTGISTAEIAGPDPSFAPARAFVHELRDFGWIDGQTVSIERLSLEGNPQRAPELLADLVARKVDVIVLGRARWLHDAALRATRIIPLITLFQDDPVAAGLITSLARPGGNLTGVAQTTGPEFFRKRCNFSRRLRRGFPESHSSARKVSCSMTARSKHWPASRSFRSRSTWSTSSMRPLTPYAGSGRTA